VIKLKQILSENAWDRKFGEPLPTLKDVLEKKNDSVNEGPDEQRPADKEVQRIVKLEGELRKRMQKLEQVFLRDGNPKSVKLAKDLTKSYKQNITKFMREMISIRKKFK
tara:strand:- start:113 stop:439 length:327 start_codon:yes stop_codon:yes gene_type:complete